IPLYHGKIPNVKGKGAEDRPNKDSSKFHRVVHPTLRIYLPEKRDEKRAAVIICAGGGYAELNIKREGYNVAEAFNKEGIAAFVLKYRLPDDNTNKNKTIAPLQDAQQAIKIVRDSAAAWNIDPGKIGIMGFSAGGHLASSAGTHYNDVLIPNKSKTNLRPDFMILVYPVISFSDAFGHIGSRNNLIGIKPSADSVYYFSNELHVTKETPPAFLVHAGDDKVVPVDNSLVFYKELNRHGINAAMHIYSRGGHGFGAEPQFQEWFGRCMNWLNQVLQ
ncbi:MAG TPA: alpha/beta hydrolase, partial [Flavisolibacter sp.]|nr:alpha/beta hydrolase [Flavisolibacter sp.]